MSELERPSAAVAWELRSHWALGRRVVVVLEGGNVEGYVTHVSASGAFALISGDDGEDVHVPVPLILSIRRPHFLEGEMTGPPLPRAPVQMDGQLSLVEPLPCSEGAEAAMVRAAAQMLAPDLLRTLQAVDELGRGMTGEVASSCGRGFRWASVRLRVLEAGLYVHRERRQHEAYYWCVANW